MADGKKISELDEAQAIEDAHYFAITDGSETQKVAYSLIKNDIVDYSEYVGTATSPTVTPSEITGGHRLTIVDVNGTSTVDVIDGVDGVDGRDGIDAPNWGNTKQLIVRSFDTVADMQAATDLAVGMTCHTNGFHAVGDGGAASYAISDTGTANGMDVLACGELYAALIITETFVTPEQFGAYGDGTHDDASSLQRTIDYATAQGIKVEFSFGKTYSVSVGITIGAVDVCMNSPILYTGDGVAVTIGERTSNVVRHCYKVWAISNNSIYVTGSVGLQVYNAINCDFNIYTISGFEHGAMFSGYNRGFGYNYVNINTVHNCMYLITLRSDGTTGWCNENYFYNGRLYVNSGLSYSNSFIGITIDSERGYLANANTFENMSIEGAGICIHVIYGMFNKFNRIRSESATLVFKDENDSNWNYVNVSYGNVLVEASGPMDVIDGYKRNYQAFCMPVFDSGFLPSKSFSNDEQLWAGKDVCFMSAHGILRKLTSCVKYNDHIQITGKNIGVMVDTTRAKKFNVTAMPYNNSSWRVFVVCYDSNDEFITTGLKSNSDKSLYMSTSTISSVSCWVTGSNAVGETFFEVPSGCVRAFIGIIAATDICGFKILSDHLTCTIIGNKLTNGLDSIPTCEGRSGDFCPSSAADNVLGWLYNGTEWVAIS